MLRDNPHLQRGLRPGSCEEGSTEAGFENFGETKYQQTLSMETDLWKRCRISDRPIGLQVFATSACCAGPRFHSHTDDCAREHDCFGGTEASRNRTIPSSKANYDALSPQAHQVSLGLWQRWLSINSMQLYPAACSCLFAWH